MNQCESKFLGVDNQRMELRLERDFHVPEAHHHSGRYALRISPTVFFICPPPSVFLVRHFSPSYRNPKNGLSSAPAIIHT
ncbi:hypothetical protein YC2023_073764 [Brassica napus]